MKETTPAVAVSEENDRLFFADIAGILKSGRGADGQALTLSG